MRTYAYGAKGPTENAELVREQLQLAHRYRNKLVEIDRARRAAREKILQPRLQTHAALSPAARGKFVVAPEDQARLDVVEQEANEAIKVAHLPVCGGCSQTRARRA